MGGNSLRRLFDKKSRIRQLLEDGHSTLTLTSSQQLGPVIRDGEQRRLKEALKTCKWVTIIFDGTTAVDEVFTIIIRTISDDLGSLRPVQWLAAVKWLKYSLSHREQAALLARVIVVEYQVDPAKIIFAAADACAVNAAATTVIRGFCPNVTDLPCVSHGACLAGNQFATPLANQLVDVWCSMVKKRSLILLLLLFY